MRLAYDATADVAYLSLRAVRRGEPLGPTLLVEPDRDFPGLVTLDFSAEARKFGIGLILATQLAFERRDGSPQRLLRLANSDSGRVSTGRTGVPSPAVGGWVRLGPRPCLGGLR